ncbi:MAG: hypothetical protein M3Z23_08895, partial [Acidobacteriota bacterium]|nr:hypothetical protein [Acidobacteriota bacterium]
DPRYARVNVVDAGLNSWYNGLVVQLNKRMAHGVTGSVSYTWSHAIDEGQGGAGTPNIFASGGPQSYLPGDYRNEKGTSTLDLRHRAGVSAVWRPVFTRSTSAVSRYLVNSWELSVLGSFSSSPQVSPTVQISSAPAPAPFTSANTGSLNGYASGRLPFQPIGSLQIDPVERIDARITKFFPITERVSAMFTFDAFNVFNHRYFTSVSTREYIETVAAGVPVLNPAAGFNQGTATGGFPDGTNARRLQIGARLVW